MFVPPPFPPPEEVQNSVADSHWKVRLKFTQLAILGIGLASLVFHLAGALSPQFSDSNTLKWTAAGLLVALSFVRVVLRNRRVETNASFILAAATVPILGVIFNSWHGFHSMIAFTALPWIGFIYSLASQRFFSFMTLFIVMALGGTAIAIAVAQIYDENLWLAVGISLACATYLAYDLSMVLRRRQIHEHWAAVADVLRDPFNVISYCQKVVRHWQKIRVLPQRLES